MDIDLGSRGFKNYLHPLKQNNPEEQPYKLIVSDYDVRLGYTENNLKYIMPPGGPCIIVGDILSAVNQIVKDILEGDDYIYIIVCAI